MSTSACGLGMTIALPLREARPRASECHLYAFAYRVRLSCAEPAPRASRSLLSHRALPGVGSIALGITSPPCLFISNRVNSFLRFASTQVPIVCDACGLLMAMRMRLAFVNGVILWCLASLLGCCIRIGAGLFILNRTQVTIVHLHCASPSIPS